MTNYANMLQFGTSFSRMKRPPKPRLERSVQCNPLNNIKEICSGHVPPIKERRGLIRQPNFTLEVKVRSLSPRRP
jgi:hypothetical protein